MTHSPHHWTRYKDILSLYLKYAHSDKGSPKILQELDLEVEEDGRAPDEKAKELCHDLEKLGPTYVKLGQLLSTRSDLLPISYIEALSRLQNKVEPFSFGEVETIVNEELGVKISKAFSNFEYKPLAAASLGQVHRAALRDGRQVVVKVQRPNIRKIIAEDFEALGNIASLLEKYASFGQRYRLHATLESFQVTMVGELDYRQEAKNLIRLRQALEEFDHIVIPEPILDYTTSRVLTMEYVSMTKLTELSKVIFTELDGAKLADQLFGAYLKQMVVDGFFHADPHPGNVCLSQDKKIALLDLGMVGHINSSLRERLLQLLLALSEARGEDAARITIEIGNPQKEFDRAPFIESITRLVSLHDDAEIGELSVGKITLQIAEISGKYGFNLPQEFTLIAKALLNLDKVVQILDPNFKPSQCIRNHSIKIVNQQALQSLSPENILRTALASKRLVENLPTQLNSLMNSLVNNELAFRVKTIDENLLLEGFEKIANRITGGLVLTGLIIGAALMTRVSTPDTLWGYPMIAMIFFLIAAVGGLVLVFNIFIRDARRKKPPS